MKYPFLLLLTGFVFAFSFCAQAQIINTIAGSGAVGFSGDGGAAAVAELRYPGDIAVDKSGNIYFTDLENNRVRKVNPSGIITTFAGNGTAGYTGDGIAATSAEINVPGGLAVDLSGSLYISDFENNRIRKVDITGIITTIAGNGTPGYSGDGTAATSAQLHNPVGIAIDGLGNIYIVDNYNNCIRKVNTSGIITTIAGNGTPGFSGDGIPATAAQLYNPACVAVDTAGNVYVSDLSNSRIRMVNQSTGIIMSIAGNGTPGYTGDGSPATAAELSAPRGLGTDSIGNLYIADESLYSVIRKVGITGIITTIAGTGTASFSGDGGLATIAQLKNPQAIAIDDTGNVFIADYGNNRVRKISSGNHLPAMPGGHAQALSVCENDAAIAVDSLLSVSDADTGQTETWALVHGPYHGSAAIAYSAVSTGGVVMPSGLSYTPAAGYSGNDTFTVRVNDGISVFTTTIYVTIDASPHAGTISGPDTACIALGAITLTDSIAGGAWGGSNAHATVSGGMVTGVTAGMDTIFYTVSNTCGTDTARRIVKIMNCIDEVNTVALQGINALVYPDPNEGTFTVNITSGKDEQASVVITNMVGEKVRAFTAITNKPIDIRLDVPVGIYYVTAAAGGYRQNIKIVVQ